MRTPTQEQMVALQQYSIMHGRTWKQALRDAWMAGGYDATTGNYIDGSLQQLRNTLGPSWLTKFRLPNIEPMLKQAERGERHG